jgi:hypothetical protein
MYDKKNKSFIKRIGDTAVKREIERSEGEILREDKGRSKYTRKKDGTSRYS